ncbi:MAG: hypothetical protein ACKOAZ_01760 [Ilumatobacteraceae bacterium]
MGKNKHNITRRIAVAAAIAASSIAYAVPADAGKAIPLVTLDSCQVSAATGNVTASGSFEGIRFGSIVTVVIAVQQSSTLSYSYVYVDATRVTRTSGTLSVVNGSPYTAANTNLFTAPLATFAVERSRSTNGSDQVACTVVA